MGAASHHVYLPSFTGLEIPVVQTSNVTSPTGCSNIASGIVATTAGVTCTFTLPLPNTLGASNRWYIAIKMKDGGDANHAGWSLQRDTVPWSGAHGSVGNSGSPFAALAEGDGTGGIATGNNTGAPAGAEEWQVVDADQQNIYMLAAPLVASGLPGTSEVLSVYDNRVHVNTEPLSYVFDYDGSQPFIGLNKLTFTTNSTASVIESIVINTTDWSFPPDGKGGPLYYEPVIGGCYPSFGTYSGDCAQVLVAAGYGSPAGTPFVHYQHPNNSEADPGTYGVAQSTLVGLYNAGYSFIQDSGAVGTTSGGGSFTAPTFSPWGAPAGLKLREQLVTTLYNDLPGHYQEFGVGFSMGCLNTFDEMVTNGGYTAIACYSGVHDLVASSVAPTSLGATIDTAYGDWWLAVKANTNDNPTANSGNWTKISNGLLGPDISYYNASHAGGQYVWMDSWNGTTTYDAGSIASTPYSGSITPGLDVYNPNMHYSAYVGIPILDVIASDDTTISPSQVTTFDAGVNAISGGNVTTDVVTPTNGPCGHLGYCVFSPPQLLNFFQTYRAPAK